MKGNYLLLLLLFTSFTNLLHAQQALIGKTNFPTYIEEAPGLPATLEEAAKWYYGANQFLQPDHTGFQQRFQPFYDKMERIGEQYKQAYGNKIDAFNAQQGEAGIQQMMAAEVNKNPIIAQMGGIEKVQNMSEAEAKAAALQAANQYMQNPGIESAGMTALYQKVMSDPAYAARFEKMSDKEKEAELRKYMANDAPVANTPQRQQALAQQQTEQQKVQNSMEINQFLTDMHVKLSNVQMAMETEFAAVTTGANNHHAIEEAHGKKLKLIPIVELGEYGHDHDPAKVQALRLETLTKHRTQATAELKQYQALLSKLRTQYKLITTEYLAFIKQNAHKINGNPEDLYKGTNTELAVASFEMSLLSLATDISKHAEQLTAEVAHWEGEYQRAKQGK
ncbi:MAG: hypothetical protein ACK4TA_07205 [Saprospiraceae bacterium]